MDPYSWPAKLQIGIGAAIAAFPAAMEWVGQYVNPVADTVGLVTGAFVGLHGTLRILRPKRKMNRRKSDHG